jgi:hypothetical protein
LQASHFHISHRMTGKPKNSKSDARKEGPMPRGIVGKHYCTHLHQIREPSHY